jgi:hypothetical protein
MFETLFPILTDYSFDFEKHIIQQKLVKEFEPFPFLTKDCLEILKKIIENEKKNVQSNDRISNFIRGIGYSSTFVRELCYHPKVLEYLKNLTELDLEPHYLLSNIAHINIGLPNNKDVDKWHFDSVSYVLIIILSEPEEFKGGILEYKKDDQIHQVKFKKAGEAFFMRGSKIEHHVTPVLEGNRMTLINSYMDSNETQDDTRIETFEKEKNFREEYEKGKKFWLNNKWRLFL